VHGWIKKIFLAGIGKVYRGQGVVANPRGEGGIRTAAIRRRTSAPGRRESSIVNLSKGKWHRVALLSTGRRSILLSEGGHGAALRKASITPHAAGDGANALIVGLQMSSQFAKNA
jgi:hypothetical protein